VLAFDMGGTRLKAAVVDGDAPFELVVADTGLASVAAVGKRLLPADAVGMCVPGVVSARGVVDVLPDKLAGVQGTDVRSWLGSTFGLPVGAVVNDAAAWGWAEAAARPGRGPVLTVTVGTGLGTALVDGTSVRGLLSGLAWEAGCLGGPGSHGPVSQARLAEALAAMCLAHEPAVVVVGGGRAPAVDGLADMVNERLAPWLEVAVEAAVSGDAGGVIGVAGMSGP
jgi:predicted NBD/HSP70 family sugar kinase